MKKILKRFFNGLTSIFVLMEDIQVIQEGLALSLVYSQNMCGKMGH